jgi:hypothetical protein
MCVCGQLLDRPAVQCFALPVGLWSGYVLLRGDLGGCWGASWLAIPWWLCGGGRGLGAGGWGLRGGGGGGRQRQDLGPNG